MRFTLPQRLRLDPVLDQQLDPVLDQPLDPALGINITFSAFLTFNVRSVCSTTSGAAPVGSACAFPFNYMGVSHFGCTTIDGDTTPWCSTQTDANDDHVGGIGAWGYCDASCPVQGLENSQLYWRGG